MLIVPLHKPLTWATWPWMTTFLLLANVAVFFGLQSGDVAAMKQAQGYYLASGLAEQEMPAYRRYLVESGRGEEAKALDAAGLRERSGMLVQASVNDLGFRRWLAQAGPGADDPVLRSRWQALRTEYDHRLDDIFTLRHMSRSSEWSPRRMLSSAFLHADPMHLFGNMLFLLALGLLLEGAIGPWRLLAVYLLGALGSSAASVLWRWGEHGGGLGASGAIAAMMGAFCAVWGRQRVRFFYWFGVVFDYVRAPAITLLPLWLGWELVSLLVERDSRIAFEAHAGGLVTGALLGALLVWTRQTRPDFMLDTPASVRDDRWERAERHLGRMENREAEALLAELALERPRDFQIALARCRVARNAGQRVALRQHTLALLQLGAADAAQVQAQWSALQAFEAEGGQLPDALRVALANHWIALGHLQEVEFLLERAGHDGAREALAQSWLKLALAHGARQAGEQQRRVLSLLLAGFPEQPQAAKARFLLDNG